MTATVEHDLRDAVLLRLLADDLAEGSRALDGAALLNSAPSVDTPQMVLLATSSTSWT